jgi:hypothetical protein
MFLLVLQRWMGLKVVVLGPAQADDVHFSSSTPMFDLGSLEFWPDPDKVCL